MRLRLLNFNIAHGRGLSLYQGLHSEKKIRANLKKIANLFKANDVKVVALQEVDEFSHWNKYLNLLRILQEEGEYEYASMGVFNRREWPQAPLIYGNAVLSRYPIQKFRNEPFGHALRGEKGFLYIELDVEGRTLPLINLHLDYRSRKNRLLQVEKVMAFIARNGDPDDLSKPLMPIVCGDFNAKLGKEKDAVHTLYEFIQGQCAYSVFPQREGTYPSLFPYRSIDLVFLPACYEALDCRVLKHYLSDHRPVLLEFSV